MASHQHDRFSTPCRHCFKCDGKKFQTGGASSLTARRHLEKKNGSLRRLKFNWIVFLLERLLTGHIQSCCHSSPPRPPRARLRLSQLYLQHQRDSLTPPVCSKMRTFVRFSTGAAVYRSLENETKRSRLLV